MKRYMRFIALAASVTLALSATACGKGGAQPAMQMQEEAKVTNVEVANPTVGTIKDEYMYSGTIQASESVDVSAKVSGTVTATYYEVGDTVQKGAVLYKIDDTDYQNSLKSAQASLKSAQAGVQSAKTSVDTANGASVKSSIESSKNAVTSAENSLETAKKSLDDSKIALDKAQSDYDINKQLYDAGGIAEETLKTYKNALDNAQNSYTRAQLSVTNAENSLEQAKTSYNILTKETTAENTRKANDSLVSAQASYNSAKVSVSNAQQQISYCTVTSPMSGTVLAKNVTTGAMASGVGYSIVDLTSMQVEVEVSEQIASSVKVGDAVTIEIPSAESGKQYSGSISEIPPGANSDGTYTVKINIPNENGKLKAGMFAKVYFAKATSNNALILPRDAVMVENDSDYYVFITSDDATATKVPVTIGIDTGETIEVTSGITKNDKIIVKGQTYLTDGDQIKIVTSDDTDTEKTTEATTVAAQSGKEAKKK